jgi:hypothetical protein
VAEKDIIKVKRGPGQGNMSQFSRKEAYFRIRAAKLGDKSVGSGAFIMNYFASIDNENEVQKQIKEGSAQFRRLARHRFKSGCSLQVE